MENKINQLKEALSILKNSRPSHIIFSSETKCEEEIYFPTRSTIFESTRTVYNTYRTIHGFAWSLEEAKELTKQMNKPCYILNTSTGEKIFQEENLFDF